MTPRRKQLAAVLLAGVLGAAVYAYYQAREQQTATLVRITALKNHLAVSNQQRAQAAKNTVRHLSTVVRQNRYQARDVAVVRQAQQIQARTNAVLDTLHQLRQAWQTADHRI